MSKKKTEPTEYDTATMAALLEEKPKRGRPPDKVSRQNVYVALRPDEKALLKELAGHLPNGLGRAYLADGFYTEALNQFDDLLALFHSFEKRILTFLLQDKK